MQPEPGFPDALARVHRSFAAQGLMQTMGARIETLAPGLCTLSAPITPGIGQQHGFAHAAASFALGDTACGYAALSLQGAETEVLTSEMKIHLLAPARGDRLIAEGSVIRPGRRLIVARADVYALSGPDRTHVATLLGTIVPVKAG